MVLTPRIKVGPPVVGELDRLLEWLYQVAVAKAHEFARRVSVGDGEIKGCQSRVHVCCRGGGTSKYDGVKVLRILGRYAICNGRASRMTYAYNVFER